MARNWQEGTLLVLGAWLLLSPFLLDYAGAQTALGNSLVAGTGVALFALLGLLRAPPWSAWAALVVGLWLMASAFALAGASAPAYWNQLAVGALIVVFGLMAIFMRPGAGRRSRE